MPVSDSDLLEQSIDERAGRLVVHEDAGDRARQATACVRRTTDDEARCLREERRRGAQPVDEDGRTTRACLGGAARDDQRRAEALLDFGEGVKVGVGGEEERRSVETRGKPGLEERREGGRQIRQLESTRRVSPRAFVSRSCERLTIQMAALLAAMAVARGAKTEKTGAAESATIATTPWPFSTTPSSRSCVSLRFFHLE